MNYGMDLVVQIHIKVQGLPYSVVHAITRELRLAWNERVIDLRDDEYGRAVFDVTSDRISVSARLSRDHDLLALAGEKEVNFDMWRSFPFDRPHIILRLEMLPVRLPQLQDQKCWVIYFQTHAPNNYYDIVRFEEGVDQLPSGQPCTQQGR